MTSRLKTSKQTSVNGNEYDGTHRLVNKKTGNRTSNVTWLEDLAACAVQNGEKEGLPALLPQAKAIKLLKYNRLSKFKRHKSPAAETGMESSHQNLRDLARIALPHLALYYIENVVNNRTAFQVNRKAFRAWLITELSNPGGNLNKYLRSSDTYEALAELERGDDWWRKCMPKNRE